MIFFQQHQYGGKKFVNYNSSETMQNKKLRRDFVNKHRVCVCVCVCVCAWRQKTDPLVQ